MTLDGKRIVVLGGSSGIGLSVAEAAAGEGAVVVIASSQQAKLDAALGGLPGTATGQVVDLSDAAAVETLFGQVGPFDHLVYTAGEALTLGSLADTDPVARHSASSTCGIGVRSSRPNTGRPISSPVVRSCSPPARPAVGRGRGLGARPPASAWPWKA